MTRFARAKGSKASNERIPEEATTWQEMKQQLQDRKRDVEDSKRRVTVEKERQSNYNKFLKEVEDEKIHKGVWAEFPAAAKAAAITSTQASDDDEDDAPEEVSSKITPVVSKVPAKKAAKKKNEKVKIASVDSKTDKDDEPQAKKRKLNKGNKKQENVHATNNESKVAKKKSDKTNTDAQTPKVNKKKDWSHLTQEEIDKRMDKKRADRKKRSLKQKEKREQIKQQQPSQEADKQAHVDNTNTPPKKLTKAEKAKQQIDFKRRKPEKSNQDNFVIVNGEKIELVRFNGFPIRKEDADRLTQLRKQLISRSIPKSEVDRTMKLERRKCEKALMRLKKVLCFNCRKSGHNMSDCPELASAEGACGICFKCGSTEHTHFECKVAKGPSMDAFKFASCFICKEQGHIARQCPDNPRGLYPKGGACKLCGDVTHFKKDCPTLQNGKEEDNGFRADVMDVDKSVDDLGTKRKPAHANGMDEGKRMPKKVYF